MSLQPRKTPPTTCITCARYFAEEALCNPSQEMLAAIHALGVPIALTELPVTPDVGARCPFWLDVVEVDRFRLLREDLKDRQALAS